MHHQFQTPVMKTDLSSVLEGETYAFTEDDKKIIQEYRKVEAELAQLEQERPVPFLLKQEKLEQLRKIRGMPHYHISVYAPKAFLWHHLDKKTPPERYRPFRLCGMLMVALADLTLPQLDTYAKAVRGKRAVTLPYCTQVGRIRLVDRAFPGPSGFSEGARGFNVDVEFELEETATGRPNRISLNCLYPLDGSLEEALATAGVRLNDSARFCVLQ